MTKPDPSLLLGVVAPEVLDAMLPYMREHHGNPSAIHSFGRTTRAAVEQARRKISGLLNCAPGEIVFTSGGTEADNMAIFGSANLIASLTPTGVIDEHRVIVNPVLLGSGTPLFKPGIHTTNLKLVRSHTFRSGNVLLCYQTR